MQWYSNVPKRLPSRLHYRYDPTQIIVCQRLMYRYRHLMLIEFVLSRQIIAQAAEDRVVVDSQMDYGSRDTVICQFADKVLSPLDKNSKEPVGVCAIAIQAKQSQTGNIRELLTIICAN